MWDLACKRMDKTVLQVFFDNKIHDFIKVKKIHNKA